MSYCSNCGRKILDEHLGCPICGVRENKLGTGTSHGEDYHGEPKSANTRQPAKYVSSLDHVSEADDRSDYYKKEYSAKDYSPRDYSPQDYNAQSYSPQNYGSNDYGSNDYASNDYGSNDYGSNDYGSKDYGLNDYSLKDYSLNDYSPKDYGSSNNSASAENACDDKYSADRYRYKSKDTLDTHADDYDYNDGDNKGGFRTWAAKKQAELQKNARSKTEHSNGRMKFGSYNRSDINSKAFKLEDVTIGDFNLGRLRGNNNQYGNQSNDSAKESRLDMGCDDRGTTPKEPFWSTLPGKALVVILILMVLSIGGGAVPVWCIIGGIILKRSKDEKYQGIGRLFLNFGLMVVIITAVVMFVTMASY